MFSIEIPSLPESVLGATIAIDRNVRIRCVIVVDEHFTEHLVHQSLLSLGTSILVATKTFRQVSDFLIPKHSSSSDVRV
jgi:hypothetical protein